MRYAVCTFLLLVAFSTTDCLADTLVITFSSGRVQSVSLDEPIASIASTEYRSADAPAAGAQPAPPTSSPQPQKSDEQPARNGGVKFKWAPPVAE